MVSLPLLLLLLLLPPPTLVQLLRQLEDSCQWQVVLNSYKTLGGNNERFFVQEPVNSVARYFQQLIDSPIDHRERYLGFPYFMKINFSCSFQAAEAFVRGGHLKGLTPIVVVTFYPPVNFRRWKTERLQIEMIGAPFGTHVTCVAAEACIMNWYTPMPMKDGSVMMKVEISSNQRGELINDAKFMININGFLKKEKDKLIFTLGNEVSAMTHRNFINTPSRPVWATVNQAPVLILGGIPDEKMILLSDSSFRDISLVELNIDSCWLGTLHCPQERFTSSIFDTISTESTLFIRQNQLVYYFTGNYFPRTRNTPYTKGWVRVLHSRCIKKLCPVEHPSNGSEYVLALAGGNEEGFFHFGTITDGSVTFKRMPYMKSMCEIQQVPKCWLHWVLYLPEQTFLLLMEFAQGNKTRFQILEYSTDPKDPHLDSVNLLFQIPPFIPLSEESEFVMLLGMEKYTDKPLVPKGLFYNPFSELLLIWGNAILQSYNNKNYIYMAKFGKESSIKYVTSNYKGEVVCVTENEEIWFIVEGSFKVYCLYPSVGWQILFTLSQMQHSELYTSNETSISIFYDSLGLHQLVYLVDDHGVGMLLKRKLPVNQILIYEQLSLTTYDVSFNQLPAILSYNNPCPFHQMQLKDLPQPQRYTRMERYHADPPLVSSPLGFHTKVSLSIYQGLVFHLLSLHSQYNKPYADPVHDPTWRWWKDKKQHKAFYFYKASNFQTKYGVHIEMDGYGKIYHQKAVNFLPECIYLDKGTIYNFSIYLFSQKTSWKNPFLTNKQNVRLAVMMAHPSCVSATVNEYYLINRNAILFKVVIKDKRQCFNQSISGQNLKKTSILIKVIGSAGRCFLRTQEGPLMQGSELIPMFIGCPPGKRLAFDITLTVQYCKTTNKRFFDCLYPDPEMPCFLFSDPFFPFFLVQDLVTGESGSFNGSYVLKVIGGGTSVDNIVDYSKDDIFRYNSPNDTTKSRIWTIKENMMDDEAFYILRHNSPGIEWLCQKNAPCNDIIPRSLHSPEFFFKIRVSTRGVDASTYCDYQLTFILHVHGLPLSSSRALMFLWGSLYVNFGCVLLFVIWNFLVPCLQSWWSNFKKKINNIIMTESFSTYTSSSGSVPSSINIKATEIAPSEMDMSVTRKLRVKKKSVISATKVSN